MGGQAGNDMGDRVNRDIGQRDPLTGGRIIESDHQSIGVYTGRYLGRIIGKCQGDRRCKGRPIRSQIISQTDNVAL